MERQFFPPNIQLYNIQFFPPNLTSIVQPLDQGIINAFKIKYRKQILNDKLESINTNDIHQMINIEILQGINHSVQAWSEIESSTIRNCFRKAGFKADQFLGDISIIVHENKDNKEIENLWSKIKKTESGYDFSYFEYVEIDSKLPSFETYSDENIVQSIVQEKQIDVDHEDEEDSENGMNMNISSKDAKDCLQMLIKIFQTNNDNCSEHINSLMKMNTCINNQEHANLKQDVLENYFTVL